MQRRQFTLAICAAGSWGFSPVARAALGMDDAAAGVRAALERGAQSAIQLLGRNDGFLGNPKVRIALPGVLDDAAKLMSKMGQKRRVDELRAAMSRAAEDAVPAARKPRVDPVGKPSVEDAIGSVRGGSSWVGDAVARRVCEHRGGRMQWL